MSAVDPVLARVLADAGVPAAGSWATKGGWVSRAWIGRSHVVRLGRPEALGAYEHEARVVAMLAGSDVPHAEHVAHGIGPDGAWSVTERLPGVTLQDAWPSADDDERRSMIESLGTALRSLHRVRVPTDLRPPWLVAALAGGAWPAYHPPVVQALPQLVAEAAAAGRDAGFDPGLVRAVGRWVDDRLPLFASDPLVLVHGDLHGSNVMVDDGRVSGIIDFAEAVAQPADVELDTILRWCARPAEFPATPDGRGLDAASLGPVPGWLRGAYPELFAAPQLGERLRLHDLYVELAIAVHHPEAAVRELARGRLGRLLDGHDHLDALGL